MNASVRLDHSLVALEGEHEVHAMLGLVAPLPTGMRKRAPLALVLDRSGSMAGPKLATAKACAAWLAQRLLPDDELALVAFDHEVRLLVPLSRVNGAHAAALAAVWEGGQTNLSGGWLKGLEQLRPVAADRPRKILLLTDGLANVGVTERKPLVALARGAARDGIGTTTIGYGHDFDEVLLTEMADAGGGNAHWAPHPEAAPAIFADELGGLTRLVAQNLSAEIRPAASVEVVSVLNEYPQVAVPGGVQVEIGDAYGGETRRLVFALRIPDLVALGPATVAELVVRYVSVGDGVAEHAFTLPIVVNAVSADEAAAVAPDREVEEHVLVLTAARARAEAADLADAGREREAERLLRGTAQRLRGAGLAAAAAELDAEAADFDRKELRYQANQARRRGPR